MRSETVDISTRDGVADAYLVRPRGDVRRPGVLLLVDAFGLRGQIEAMADRIAARGYTVLAPNVFYRAGRAPVVPLDGIGDPERRGDVIGRVMPLVRELTTDRIVSDGDGYLSELERLTGGPSALTGYCMGGRLAWRIAAAYPERVVALGCFHTSGLVTDEPDSPHLSAEAIAAEVYMGVADNDRGMTPEQVATVERALADAGVAHRAEIYAGAAHGYTMADTPVYDEAATDRHYRALFALLERS